MSEIYHPGLKLKELLDNKNWSQSDLVLVSGCSAETINLIIAGKRGISPAMSKILGKAFDLKEDHFLSLQKEYDISQADEPNPIVELRAKLQSNYPLREMIKRGWLKEDGDLEEQFIEFFEVDKFDEVPHIAHAAKKSRYEEKEIPAPQLAWLYRVRQIAKTMVTPKYSHDKLKKQLEKLRELIIEPEEARHVPKIMHECGVRFVVVENLPQSKIDGVCFWLDGNSPVIGLSTRYDRIDNFWFVLRHEIEHVLQEDGKNENVPSIDEFDNSINNDTLPKEEQRANNAAADFCVSAEKIKSFILRKGPFFYEKDVLAFAKVQQIHPGIIVGQIQHKLKRYDYLKKHQVKIRQCVLPGARVDGWGYNDLVS